ncbi:hypothetical protein CIHG_09706 [Coccidioides immitis H538.4]|uniref:Uncharacterized protein n=2 Tax=Coccidioides immitis TaxID=5501 RepID=A0A0J8S3A4_COCIT|nr:hypothetical protein CIRG_09699 [Coccidioides immitis RMSCC 2394]KMU91925.1 hypothetical protein CIHG_09706 [Coccidioides immitis H538.4]
MAIQCRKDGKLKITAKAADTKWPVDKSMLEGSGELALCDPDLMGCVPLEPCKRIEIRSMPAEVTRVVVKRIIDMTTILHSIGKVESAPVAVKGLGPRSIGADMIDHYVFTEKYHKV